MAAQPTYKRLSNGLQSLSEASPDYELAPVGIASMHDQAQKLAEYGRNGDIYVIHAAEGETVIPMEVLNANPQIKQLLFAQMKDMGLDPQEFVVGNELNSINPVTGLPEFFFKSIFRAVKKAVKKVFKFAKKIAPIAIPLAASAFGFPFLGTAFLKGTFGAAALGSGLGSLAGGGSLKDAFKSALIGGGISTLGSGLVKGFGATGDQGFGEQFMKGVGESFTGTQAAATPLGQFYEDKLGVPEIWPESMYDNLATEGAAKAGGGVEFAALNPDSATDAFYTSGPGQEVIPEAQRILNKASQDAALNLTKPVEVARHAMPKPVVNVVTKAGGTVYNPFDATVTEPTFLQKAGQYFPTAGPEFKGSIGPEALERAKNVAFDKAVRSFTAAHNLNPANLSGTAATNAKIVGQAAADKITTASLSPGMIQQYGGLGAAGLGAAYYGGMFDPPEEEEEVTEEDLQFGTELSGPNPLFEADPDKFKIPVDPFQFQTASSPFVPTQFAADGGMIRGPGTGTSDSIPGWLSDGEFVLTERAVRGADPTGQGRRDAGANNLYNIMRNFEMRA